MKMPDTGLKKLSLIFTVLGILLLETGVPGLIITAIGVIGLVFSGFFSDFINRS